VTEPNNRTPTLELLTLGGRTVRAGRWVAPAPANGTKPRPILFFNGIGANIELMSPLGTWFDDRDIITFDMPGVGRSPSALLPYRPWMMANFTRRLLDHYGYDVVDVMGVSWGGCMAQQFAWQFPKRTGRLLLAATSAGMLMVPGDPGVLSKMATPKRYTDPNYMIENFKKLYGGETAGSDGHANRLLPPSIGGYLYQLTCMLGWTSAWLLPFLKAETLILMGDADKIVPVVNGEILKMLTPASRLVVVKGGGHLFLVSRAGEVTPIIRDFYDNGLGPAGKKAANATAANVAEAETISKRATPRRKAA
jgi:poly(3-hydroxyalkanoate) depolymerase